MNIEGRLEKLEASQSEQRVIFVWRDHTETSEQAKERWRRENPGQDLERPGLKVIVIGWSG